jgi:E3 SUMO-protein ligase PIAS2
MPFCKASLSTFSRTNLIYPTFPDVTMRPLPFYKIVAVLMQPCSLQPSGNARFQEQKFSFYLSPTQVESIERSAYRDTNGRPDHKRQVQLRFSLLETSCDQDDNFPSSLCVKVFTVKVRLASLARLKIALKP